MTLSAYKAYIYDVCVYCRSSHKWILSHFVALSTTATSFLSSVCPPSCRMNHAHDWRRGKWAAGGGGDERHGSAKFMTGVSDLPAEPHDHLHKCLTHNTRVQNKKTNQKLGWKMLILSVYVILDDTIHRYRGLRNIADVLFGVI